MSGAQREVRKSDGSGHPSGPGLRRRRPCGDQLFVGGLSYSTTSESLREYFAQCGTVESATVITDRATGQSRGFGFVEMATEADGQAAISKLNDKPFEGRRLTVNVAEPPGSWRWRRGPRRRSPGRIAVGWRLWWWRWRRLRRRSARRRW